jgi:hypothetical protein
VVKAGKIREDCEVSIIWFITYTPFPGYGIISWIIFAGTPLQRG